ncbi:GAF and ANTAR domain-containing protein [Arthrobacter sp. NyZ413]|uniref:GAF and ANTAR domain-containing protein n=1 Tax=Arthrobacter sp. NyZ413 TaxID=3144669 RepID=UPI002BD61F31|nr:GAF and ANTAR domain-containing protein [Arthrobacter sp.]
MEAEKSTDPKVVSSEIQDLLLDTPDVEAFLSELARHSASVLGSPDNEMLCGVTLLRHGSAGTVASSSERALKLDELQYRFAEGPCLTACKEGIQVHIPDLEKDKAWPEYGHAARENGVRSILALPIPLVDGTSRAGLNIYSEQPNTFDEAAVQRASDYAQQASKGLRLAIMIAQHSETAANLRAAMESRTVIDVATGIIVAQNRCTQAEALDVLKKASSNRNIKLRDIAAAVVESAGGGAIQSHFS